MIKIIIYYDCESVIKNKQTRVYGFRLCLHVLRDYDCDLMKTSTLVLQYGRYDYVTCVEYENKKKNL